MTTSLVLELQRDASNPAIAVSDLLRKTVTVARKLGLRDVETWVSRETSGYENGSSIPAYRLITGQIMARNPHNRSWIPVVLADPAQAESFSKRYAAQSIAELEHLLDGSNGRDTMQMPFRKDIEARLMAAAEIPLMPTLMVQTSSISHILSAVRDRVLEWSLELERTGVLGEGMSFTQAERDRAASVIHNETHFHGPVSEPQIQQFTRDSTQSSTHQGLDLAAVQAFTTALRDALADLRLSLDAQRELEAELMTIAAQTASPKPKGKIVGESLRTIRNILEGAMGSALATALLGQLATLTLR